MVTQQKLGVGITELSVLHGDDRYMRDTCVDVVCKNLQNVMHNLARVRIKVRLGFKSGLW